jgi:hypothetical protein
VSGGPRSCVLYCIASLQKKRLNASPAIHVRNRARDLQNAVMRPRGKPQPRDRVFQQLFALGRNRAMLADHPRHHLRIRVSLFLVLRSVRAACFLLRSPVVSRQQNPPLNPLTRSKVGLSTFNFSSEDQRRFFLAPGDPPFSSKALMAFTKAAPLARNSLMRSPATCSSSFSPRGSSATNTLLRSSRLRLRRT